MFLVKFIILGLTLQAFKVVMFFLRVKDNFNTPRKHEEGSNDLLIYEGAEHLQSNPKLHRGVALSV